MKSADQNGRSGSVKSESAVLMVPDIIAAVVMVYTWVDARVPAATLQVGVRCFYRSQMIGRLYLNDDNERTNEDTLSLH